MIKPSPEDVASHRDVRDIAALAGITAAIRLVIAAILPARALSEDIHIWQTVTAILMRGDNPYVETPLLFYPPFWMQVLYVLGRISQRTGISLAHLIQFVLTLTDVAIVVLVYALLKNLGAGNRAYRLALIGFALNPISIILTCEHGNFDSVVGLLVLATVFGLVRWNEGAGVSSWLMAAMTVGLGILAKTVPLITAPLLLVRWRETDWPARIVAAALVIGPSLIGVSVLYVLAPKQTAADIFQYRSAAGWFGVSGVLNIIGGQDLARHYSSIYPLLAVLVVGAAGWVFARMRVVSNHAIVLGCALLLMWVPPLGSGYGPQYAGWFLGVCVVLYGISAGALRTSLLALGLVALATYVLEYGLVPTQGAFLSLIAPHRTAALSQTLSQPEGQTLLRFPLFVAYLVFLAVGLRDFVGEALTGGNEPAGAPADVPAKRLAEGIAP